MSSDAMIAEIERLHDMRTRGVIDDDEFKEMKRLCIKKHSEAGSGGTAPQPSAPAPAPAPVTSSSVGGVFNPGVAASIDTSFFEESHTGAHDVAYAHLSRILENLLRYPDDQRYKRLRTQNPKLAAELFSDPGSEPLLKSIGFELVPGETVGVDGDALTIRGNTDTSLVQAALTALGDLQRRDADAAAASRQYRQLRSSAAIQVRKEEWERAVQVGELQAHIQKQLIEEGQRLGDEDLSGALQGLQTLRTIVTNISANPAEAKFRTLKLGNAAVARVLFHMRGGLEFLCGGCGFQLREDAIVLPNETTIPESMVGVLDGLESEAQRVHDDVVQAQRDAARAAIMRERQHARREENRQRQGSSQEGAAHDTTSEDSGRRVKVADAINFLLGNGPNPLEAMDLEDGPKQ